MTGTTRAEERPAGLESAAGGNPRFPAVEGLRAVAAVSVLIHHVAGTTGAVTATAWGYVTAHLDVGVSVFFVLSGFLLYRPFVAGSPGLRRYAGRRALRIFPAYWLALAGVFFVLDTVEYGDLGNLARYATLTHIYSKDLVLGGIVPAWSLATELGFYAFLPIWAVAVAALARRSPAPLAVHAAGVVLLLVTGLTVHAWLLFSHDEATPATLWLPAQLHLFALGMGLAVAHVATQRGIRLAPFEAAGRWPASTWLLAMVPFWVSATQLDLPRVFADMPDGGAFGREICYGLTALLLVAAVVFGDPDRGWPRRVLRWRPVAWVGLVSYGVFLWHFDLLKWFAREGWLDWWSVAPFWSAFALTLGASVVVAWVSWIAVESPLLRRQRGVRR